MLTDPEAPSVPKTPGVRGFVALNPESETGANNEEPRTERHDTEHGTTPRRRLHVHDHVTSRKPPDVTSLSHPGGLRAIMRGPMAADEAAGAADEAAGAAEGFVLPAE